MPSRKTDKALNIASYATLVVALALSVPVAERLIGATWQWYKFAGHANDGHITLSLNTGLWLSCVLAVTFGLALWLHRIAKHRPAPRAPVASLSAMCVVAVVAMAYWLLGVSSLNAWRA